VKYFVSSTVGLDARVVSGASEGKVLATPPLS
jgi:hypothetical protein